jgi:hypothetical protein
VLRGEGADGALVNELLAEFHTGLEYGKLRELLRASDDAAVSAGVWIASELGGRGRELLADVMPLLRHARRDIRYFALDYLITNLRRDDSRELLSTLDLLVDPEPAIRRAAMRLLATIDGTIIASAASASGAERVTHGLLLLVAAGAGQNDGEIEAALANRDPLTRRYAAAAAARRLHGNSALLRAASESPDDDVSGFSADWLTRIARHRTRGSSGN